MPKSIDDFSPEELEELAKRKRTAAKTAAGSAGRHVLNVSLDLADAAQVALARKLGFVNLDDDEEPEGEEPEGEEETPARTGYFGS